MKTRTNKLFDERFGEVFQKSETLPPELLSIVNSGFILEDGAWFIASLRGRGSNANRASFSTSTEFECFINHFHVDDFGEQNLLENALYCDAVLRQRLAVQSGKDAMRSIISLDEAGCNFRCHMIRAGERWNVDDLDSYKEEAVLVIDP
jgi:hypothetical protein